MDSIEIACYEHPKLTDTGQRVDKKPKWKLFEFNLYPVVLEASGLPWPEANIYILSRLENTLSPSMSTYDGIAEDLTAYRRFCDDEIIDWCNFPAQKLGRPTYRYSNHLRRGIETGAIAISTAKRRISSVIAFYTWLKDEGILVPAHVPWKESDKFLKLTGTYGFEFIKKVTTTDISIRIPAQHDPYDGAIDDGGKLRPLPLNEQRWILEALIKRGNTEMTLIHVLALLSGARIQTVLTFRVRHVYKLVAEQPNSDPSTEIRCPVGPGTGIDTKRDKRLSLHLPLWFCRMLLTYVESERARRRRALAKRGDTEDQYLFLSKYGTPFYSCKEDNRIFDADSNLRHHTKGQSIRKFMSEVVIPYVRMKYDVKFRYRFHDLRASFGMNLTDTQLKLVAQNKKTLNQVREYVKVRMGHESAATTDLYLQFRDNAAHVLQVIDGHDDYLQNLAASMEIL
ncbi:site-specific integrase [Herbaspirillum sp. RV1423]|uniref:site-specific integrase n=1 Tax=Herbaspirillum sp. RV1423 TaxID=1443993 RepID=UPI0018CC2828|nr:site-specific integrase [Herbaspirillum sp. RV1423]